MPPVIFFDYVKTSALDYESALIKLAAIKLAAREWLRTADKHDAVASKLRPGIYDMDNQRHRSRACAMRDCAGTIKNILESK